MPKPGQQPCFLNPQFGPLETCQFSEGDYSHLGQPLSPLEVQVSISLNLNKISCLKDLKVSPASLESYMPTLSPITSPSSGCTSIGGVEHQVPFGLKLVI